MIRESIYGVSLAAALGAGVVVTSPAQTYTMEALENSIVQIDGQCSGVVIPDPDTTNGVQLTVITAGHCVMKEGDKALVEEEEGDRFGFTVVDISRDLDLALLQMEYNERFDEQTDEAQLGENAEFGDVVYIAGFPFFSGLPLGQQISTGLVSSFEIIPELWMTYPFVMWHTAAAAPGNSGGGVFTYDVYNGYSLVGILVGGFPGTSYSFSVPVSSVDIFIAGFLQGSNK